MSDSCSIISINRALVISWEKDKLVKRKMGKYRRSLCIVIVLGLSRVSLKIITWPIEIPQILFIKENQ